MRALFPALILALWIADDAAAHGGSWRGGRGSTGKTVKGGNPGRHGRNDGGGANDGTTDDGGSADAGDPSPSDPTPSGPATPAPRAPTSPAPSAPSAPNAPSTPTAGRTSGPGLGRRAGTSSDSWEHWWALQRELYLRRHTAGWLSQPTASSDFLSGRSAAHPAAASGLLPETARRELLPILALALRDRSSEIADSAAIAIGRMVGANEGAPLLPLLVNNLAHVESSPREAAILALGMIGGTEATQKLGAIALDTPEGRRLCGAGGPLDPFLRGLSVLSLGLLGSQDSLAPLRTLVTTPTTARELKAAAVLALGLQRDAAASAVIPLLGMLDDRALDREVRAQVPIALARLPQSTARAVLPKLLSVLADKRTSPEMARSIVIALGRIATPEDGEVVTELMNAVQRTDDPSTRNLATLALGRLFEKPETYDTIGARQRATVHQFLLEQVRRPAARTVRPYAALALGIFGRGDPKFGVANSDANAASAKRLLELLAQEADPSVQGATAIALGLLRAADAAPPVRTLLGSTGNPALRGHLATALGLLGDREAVPALKKLVADPGLLPATRIDVARALAMVGDPDFEQQLLDLLAQETSPNNLTAFAKAIGLVGGKKSIDTLRDMAGDSKRPEVQRVVAVVALGLLAEKSALPWNVRYLVDANYTVPSRVMDEVADLL